MARLLLQVFIVSTTSITVIYNTEATTTVSVLHPSDSTCGAESQFYCPTAHKCVRDCAGCSNYNKTPLKDSTVSYRASAGPNTCRRPPRRKIQSQNGRALQSGSQGSSLADLRCSPSHYRQFARTLLQLYVFLRTRLSRCF